MREEQELSPEQEFNKILGEGALEIKRLEQLRDNPPRQQGPALRLTPPGSVQGNGGGNRQAHKDHYNDAIGNKKADVIKQTDALIKQMPKDAQKGLKDKVLTTMYPKGGDLNQINHPSKAIDNAQERLNDKKANPVAKGQPSQKAQSEQTKTEGAGGQSKTASTPSTRFNQLLDNKKSITDKQPEQSKASAGKTADKTDGQDKGSSMSTRFSQSLTQKNPEQDKADAHKATDKADSQSKATSTRFSQSLTQSNDKAASSSPGKSIGSMSGKSSQSLSKD